MKIDQPTWQMKIPCPCCGQGTPVFVACSGCGFVTVHCDEVGATFLDPHQLEKGHVNVCPSCGVRADAFRLATSEEIVEAGFSKGEFE